MIAVAATIAAAIAGGVLARRRFGERTDGLARAVLNAMLYTLVPFVAFFNVARLHVDVDVGAGIALAYVSLALCGLAAWAIARRGLALSRPATGSVVVAAIQANTGYLGYPLCAVLLGSDRLGEAVAFDTFVSAPALLLGAFGIAAALGTRAGEGARERGAAFLARNPPLVAVVAALLAPDALAPDALVDVSRALVVLLAPLGFFALGVTLAAEEREGGLPFPPPLGRPVATALALRLVLAPALLALLALPLIDLPGTYLLQAAMPCGINGLVVAHAYGLDLRISAGAIAWSTALVVVTALVSSLL